MAGQLHLSGELSQHLRCCQLAHLLNHPLQVGVHLGIGVDFQRVQIGQQASGAIIQRAVEHIAQAVRRVSRDDQAALPPACREYGQRRSDRGLADAALAADPQQAAVQQVKVGSGNIDSPGQQQRKWSSGECSIPMRRCQSWKRSSSSGCSSSV